MNKIPTNGPKTNRCDCPLVPPPDVLVRNDDPPALAAQGEVDKKEHYDLDGVSYENGFGVVVASDASKIVEEIQRRCP